MALGGGMFTTQNKVLPGAYLNFISVANASTALSERGIATLPVVMNWGPEQTVFTVTVEEFMKDTRKIFGYDYTAEQVKPMREIFKSARTVHFFRLNGTGKKAENTLATAKYPGTRGNDLRIVVEANENSTEGTLLYDVTTYLDGMKVDEQFAISQMADLVGNDYVTWKKDGELELTASLPLMNGENGAVENSAYQTYLEQVEGYTFHTMGCTSADKTITQLFAAFTKRMRNEVGKKFQCVVAGYLADEEGVISIKNKTVGAEDGAALIPWVTGVMAGMRVNQSATNLPYDGEYEIEAIYSQKELEDCIQEGSLVFHLVDGAPRILRDINTLVTFTEEKSKDFAANQTIRVLDQVANDIALLFSQKYIGKIANDGAGRISLWNDIVKHHQELAKIRAIENFDPEQVTVAKGDSKQAVVVTDCITPINAMDQLYMTIYVA
ncbi:MAG: phage tail protein [Peptococcaceae bacterium]|nr:phage tail protein [Peptococcaceae bacterium]